MDYFQLILTALVTPFTLIWVFLAVTGGKRYQKYTDSAFAKEFQMSELLCVGFRYADPTYQHKNKICPGKDP